MTGIDRFPEIVGHARAKAYLAGLLRTGRLPTGLLLHGGRGRGKRALAMALLRRVHCTVGGLSGAACTGCDSCRKLDAGYHPDIEVLEVPTGKTRVPIDRVRELKEWFSLAPFQSRHRSALVDDAHLLTEEAQNALLKLLEEPPRQGLLVLVAPETGALLPTILSRVQRTHLGPVGPQHVPLLADKFGVNRDALAGVWGLCDGSPGRALEMLNDPAIVQAQRQVSSLFEVGRPFSRVDEALAAPKGAPPERERTAALLEVAIDMLCREMTAKWRRGPAPSGSLPTLVGLPAATLERLLGHVLLARRMVRSFVGPRLVLDALLIRTQRELATVKRA